MLQGFERIHYLAYSLFFMGKVMFIASVGGLYSDNPNSIYYGMAYVGFVLASLLVGLYDQKRTVGFGIDELKMEWPLAPVRRYNYKKEKHV